MRIARCEGVLHLPCRAHGPHGAERGSCAGEPRHGAHRRSACRAAFVGQAGARIWDDGYVPDKGQAVT